MLDDLRQVYFFVLISIAVSYSSLIICCALISCLVSIVAPIIKRQLRLAAEANASANALMVESLTGIQMVKAQHAETNLRWRWQQRYARFISSNFRTALIGATSGSIGSFFNEIGGLAVLWVGAYLVLEGQLTVGQLIAFRIISGNVVGPIIRLASTWQSVQSLQISLSDWLMWLMLQPNSPKMLSQLPYHLLKERLSLKRQL